MSRLIKRNIAEQLENKLPKAGFTPHETAAVINGISTLPLQKQLAATFNLDAVPAFIKKVSDATRIERGHIKSVIIKKPEILLSLATLWDSFPHAKPKPPEPPKPEAKIRRPASDFPNLTPVVAILLPSNEAIAIAALAVYRKKGHIPGDKYKGDNETLNMAWTTIAEKLRLERNTTIRLVTINYCREMITAGKDVDDVIRLLAGKPDHWSKKKPYSEDDIEASLRATVEEKGKRPNFKKDKVEYGPLADGELMWRDLQNAMRRKYRGLEDCKYNSLLLFAEGKNIPKIWPPAPKKKDGRLRTPLSLADIAASGEATVDAKGTRPPIKAGLVEYGPLAGKEKWIHINMAFIRGQRGLKDCGYTTLTDFFNFCGIGIEKPATDISAAGPQFISQDFVP